MWRTISRCRRFQSRSRTPRASAASGTCSASLPLPNPRLLPPAAARDGARANGIASALNGVYAGTAASAFASNRNAMRIKIDSLP